MKGLNTNKNSLNTEIGQSGRIDAAVYSGLYDKYVASIYRYIFFKVNVAEIAEDLTGDTFLKTWQYLQNGHQIDNIKAFFYQTASNLVTDYYRSRASKSVSIDKAEKIIDTKAASEIDKINLNTELAIIQETLKQLNETYKEIIVLYFIEQLTITEIANIKNKSEGAIRVLIHRALKSIKNKLPKEYVEAMQKIVSPSEKDQNGRSDAGNSVLIENLSVE